MQKVIAKIAGAGTGMTVLFLWILFSSRMDWFKVSETLSDYKLWLLFFGYGLLVALLVEGVLWKFQLKRRYIWLFSYMAAGFLLFFAFGVNVFAVIAGIISAVFALFFYIGEMAARHSKLYRFIFAFVLPVSFLVIASIDFSVQHGWEENRTQEGYEATFEYFQGEHRIPVELKKGESVAFTINVDSENGGSYGYSFEDAKGHPTGMDELGGDWLAYEAEQDGIYYIVLRGHQISGSILIDWKFKRIPKKQQ